MLLEEVAAESTAEAGSWWDNVVASFSEHWWGFIVGLAVILGIMLLISILSRGKFIKFKTVIKVGFNAVFGFVIIFVFNLIAAAFGATFVATWWEWLIIGLAGIPGAIMCIIFSFIWPGIW